MSDKYDIDFGRYLRYNEESPSGLVWNPRRVDDFKSMQAYEAFHTKHLNKTAGSIIVDRHGYAHWQVKLYTNVYVVSKIIYIIMVGPIDGGLEIDHIDGNSLNNILSNLRPATRIQNRVNSKSNSKFGFKGVMKSRSRFSSLIRVNKESIYLGSFDSPEEANEAYIKAAIRIYGEFSRAK